MLRRSPSASNGAPVTRGTPRAPEALPRRRGPVAPVDDGRVLAGLRRAVLALEAGDPADERGSAGEAQALALGLERRTGHAGDAARRRVAALTRLADLRAEG